MRELVYNKSEKKYRRFLIMNLPNKITLTRVILIPVCILTLLSNLPFTRILAVIIFIVASLTDALDGYIARSQNLITNFGKFMDPLVDKLLVNSVLIALVQMRNLSCWVVIIIIWREFIVTGFRLTAVSENVVIPANNLGKIKTVLQMIMTVIVMLDFKNDYMIVIKYIFIGAALIFTIISGCDYVYKNKGVLKE